MRQERDISAVTRAAATVETYIARPLAEVYGYLSDPGNLPAWASGLCRSIERQGNELWVGQTVSGQVTIRFAGPNEFGILDHHVSLPDGSDVYVPMRAVRNGEGSEVMLTVFRRPGMTDAAFEADLRLVERDLAALKTTLERRGASRPEADPAA
jgi:hypothetical protein